MLTHVKLLKRLVRFIPVKESTLFVSFQLVSLGLGIYVPLKLRHLFQQLIAQRDNSIIWFTVLTVFAVVIIKIIVDLLSRLYITKLPNLLCHKVRLQLFDLFKSIPYTSFMQYKREDLSNTMENLTGECGMYLNYFCLLLMNIFSICAMWVAGCILSWKLAITLWIISPLFIFINWRVSSIQQKYGTQLREINMSLNNEILYQTRSISSIKLNYAFAWHKKNLHRVLANFRSSQLKQGIHSVEVTLLSDITILLFFGCLSGIGMILAINGKLGMDVLLAYLSIIGGITRPLSLITGQWINLNMKLPVAHKVIEFFNNPYNENHSMSEEQCGTVCVDLQNYALQVKDVSFKYPGNQAEVLKNISFQVQPGELVAVVGPSGAGKSTLFHILAGLFTPSSGAIFIGDSIGVIPQVPYIFEGTIEDNVKLGRLCSVLEIEEVLRNAQLTGRAFDLNSYVSEQGKNFSLGEKQRVGIARTLIANNSVLLMDEPGANLDNETYYKMMSVIESLKGKKTILLIAHRIETIKNSDRILVLNEGVVESFGKWDEVEKNSTTFKNVLVALGGENNAICS